MAGAYLFHLVQNHPFLDGNKRVGAAAALTFLVMNGIETRIPNEALAQMVLSVAQGKADKTAIADSFVSTHVTKYTDFLFTMGKETGRESCYARRR